jgi:hypothetical protein
MEKYCIFYSMALEMLGRGRQIGLINAKGIYEFTKGDFENNENFTSLIEDYLNGKISFEDAEDTLFNNLVKEFKTTGISDWTTIGAYIGSENVFKLFSHLQNDLKDKDYWTVLGECYVMSSFSHSNFSDIITFFQSKRSDRINIMTEEEKFEFDSLPDEIEIYRGCSEHEIKSGNYRFSWTTKKSVAQFFAKRNKTKHGIKNLVVSRIIKKEEVFAYFNRRNEFEIIYIQNN